MSATTAPLLTDAEIDAINDVRSMLGAIERRTYGATNSYGAGAIAALADTADDTLFRLLNWTKHTGGQDIPEAVLHNRSRTGAAEDEA